jgi:hypothetical protein
MPDPLRAHVAIIAWIWPTTTVYRTSATVVVDRIQTRVYGLKHLAT